MNWKKNVKIRPPPNELFKGNLGENSPKIDNQAVKKIKAIGVVFEAPTNPLIY